MSWSRLRGETLELPAHGSTLQWLCVGTAEHAEHAEHGERLEPTRALSALRHATAGFSLDLRYIWAFMCRHGLADGLPRHASAQWMQIESALRFGQMSVVERRRVLSTYSHTDPEAEPDQPPAPAPEPIPEEPRVTERRTVEYLAVGDFNFATDRAIMLPGPSSEGERVGDQADGIALVAGLLAHLRQLSDKRKVLVAGHTDAAGSFAHNLELSEQRAWSVQLACAGDADGFADHAVAHAHTADGQEVLRWIARRFGWGCDPGPCDNDDGPNTSSARAHFRDRFRVEFGGDAGAGSGFVRADWLAFFRLYEQDLAARLGVTPSALPDLRTGLAWAEPSVLGCGEHWPEAKVGRARVNRDDRRVELLCFAPDQLPSGAGHPPGASVYGDSTYSWTPIRPGPGPHPLGGPCFELALMAGDLGGLDKRASLRLRGGPYDLRHAVADARKRGEYRVFHFHGIAKGQTYTLTFTRRDGIEPTQLFEGVSLDSYIEGIGAPEQQPAPIFVHLQRPAERREDDPEVTQDE